jgi:hypothetical protein
MSTRCNGLIRTSSESVLYLAQNHKATDARDKGYGILALAQGQKLLSRNSLDFAYAPKIGYNLWIRDVYLEAAKACMRVQGQGAKLTFLYHAGHMPAGGAKWCESNAVTNGEHWPSWLPERTVSRSLIVTRRRISTGIRSRASLHQPSTATTIKGSR